MKELIGKHQKIIIFSDKIERIFSYIALIQFLSSTLLTCCVGFTVITISNSSLKVQRTEKRCGNSDLYRDSMLQSINMMQNTDTIDSTGIIKAVVFYMVATVEAFIFCFCGEYLSAKVRTIEIFTLDFHCRDVNLRDSAIHCMISNHGNCIFIMENAQLFKREDEFSLYFSFQCVKMKNQKIFSDNVNVLHTIPL